MDGDTMLNITNTIAARERNIILSTLTDSARKAVVNVTGMLMFLLITFTNYHMQGKINLTNAFPIFFTRYKQ